MLDDSYIIYVIRNDLIYYMYLYVYIGIYTVYTVYSICVDCISAPEAWLLGLVALKPRRGDERAGSPRGHAPAQGGGRAEQLGPGAEIGRKPSISRRFRGANSCFRGVFRCFSAFWRLS